MKKLKKLFTIIAVIALSLSLSMPVFAVGTSTVTVTKVINLIGLRLVIGTVTPSAAYTTGGDNMNMTTGSGKLFTNLWAVMVESKSGYIFEYDHTGKKLKIKYPTKSQAAATTSGNAASVGTAGTVSGALTIGTIGATVGTAATISGIPGHSGVFAVASGSFTANAVDAVTPTLTAGTFTLTAGSLDAVLDSNAVTFSGVPGIGSLDAALDSGTVTVPSGFRSAVDTGVAEEVSAGDYSSTPGATKFVAFGN